MTSQELSRRGFLVSMMVSATALSLEGRSRIQSHHGDSANTGREWNYPQGAIRLNANENPLGPSPKAVKAMEKALLQAHRYTQASTLRRVLASYHGLPDNGVLIGCGSTEILRIAPWAFLRDGGELLTALQSYQTLIKECGKMGAKVNATPLNSGFSFDLDSMRKALTANTRMVYLVNPNNPTGTCLQFEEIESFCASLPKEIIVFIDEAYSHFLNDQRGRDGISLVKQGYNVIVTRTFSKVHAMAGMRLGYAVSRPSVIELLSLFSLGDLGINQAAFAGGLASLEDESHVRKYKALIREGKEFYYDQLDSMGLDYIPSETPFFMVKLNMSSKVAQKELAEKRILVRKGEDWNMPGFIRISIGFREENHACVAAIREITLRSIS